MAETCAAEGVRSMEAFMYRLHPAPSTSGARIASSTPTGGGYQRCVRAADA